jgi:type IV pilus assembly protein PilB
MTPDMAAVPGVRALPDVLLQDGLVTSAQLDEAWAEHERSGAPLGHALVRLGHLTESELVRALASQIGLDFVDLSEHQVDAAAVTLLDPAVCRRHCVLPVAVADRRLVLAMADPGNVFALDDVRHATGREVQPVVATRDDLLSAIERHCREDAGSVDLAGAGDEDDGDDLGTLKDVVDDSPIVKYVNMVVTQAVQDRASDIHVEPGEHHLRIRYRIDGVLHEVMESPRAIASGVVSRLKIMSDIDIAERRRPQDGRLSLTLGGRTVDLRVATLPTVWGEKVVLRILDNSATRLGLGDLGFTPANEDRFRDSYTKPYGMILVTGPTGSGKSTTLYATLNAVSKPDINVITVEDPVEYRLPGINQVQINAKAGLTFAAALRSILRSDPDVVLLGEIRDHETAQISIEAALTGHLVLSTLHTNDAPSAVTRLTEMDVEPFLVGSALDCVVAQRLARRLCPRCKEPTETTDQEVELLATAGVLLDDRDPAGGGTDGPTTPRLYRPVGCPACSRTGYKGRLAVQEIMVVTEDIERLCVARASTAEIAEAARADGMRTLRQDGLGKVAAGHTTVEEILRVVA